MSDYLIFLYYISNGGKNLRKIAIERMVPAAVIDDHELAEPLERLGEDDLSGIDGRASREASVWI